MDENGQFIKIIRNDESYYCYDWVIPLKCLCNVCLRDRKFYSPKFTAASILSEDASFKLHNLSSEKTMKLTPVHYRRNANNNFIDCKIRISVRNNKGKICYPHLYSNIELHYYHNPDCIPNYEYAYSNLLFIDFSLINNCDYIPDGKLTLVVEIFKPVEEVKVSAEKNSSIEKAGIEKVLINFQRNEELCDVTLVVGEREFRAHKVILAARSSVFLAMFSHEVRETIENKVVIDDVSEETMQRVLDYIYSGTVEYENFEDITAIGEFLSVADKYDLQDLAKICECSMIRLLNTDNALQLLETADINKLDSLKNAATNIIAQNVEQVMETDGFKKLLDPSKLCLMKEIVLAIKNN